MSIKPTKKIYRKKFYDSSKLELIKNISALVTQYHNLVLTLSDIFTTEQKQQDILKEIQMLEDVIKSKLIISSQMRGF